MRGGADSSNQSRGMEKLCEGPRCHEGTGRIGEGEESNVKNWSRKYYLHNNIWKSYVGSVRIVMLR